MNFGDLVTVLNRVPMLFEEHRYPLAVYSLDARLELANRALRDLIGVANSAALQSHAVGQIASESRGRMHDLYLAAVRGDGACAHAELQLMTADGAALLITSTFRLAQIDGVDVAVYGYFDDVTADRKLREDLFRCEQQLHGLFHNAPDPIAAVDLRGRYVQVNAATERLYGYRNDDLAWMHLSKIFPGHRNPIDKIVSAISHGQSVRYEATAIRKDGRRLRVSGVAVPQVVAGEVVGLYKFSHDVPTAGRGRNLLEADPVENR